MFDNLITTFLFLLELGLLFLVDTVLGVLVGTKEQGFNCKKFFYGLLKGLIAGLCIVVFCFVIEITPAILRRIDVELPDDIITLVEFIGIAITAYKKYCLECLEKIKKIFGL